MTVKDLEYTTTTGETVPASFVNGDYMYIVAEEHVTDDELMEWADDILVDHGQPRWEAQGITERAEIYHTFARWDVDPTGETILMWPAEYSDIPVTVMELW